LANFAKLPSIPSDNSIITVTPTVPGRDRTSLFEDIARHWARSSILMHTLLAARRVPYFHFLQPNQYYSTRTFGDEEARAVRNDSSPFKEGAEKGYPHLVAESQVRTLTDNQVRFFDATHIFDRERSAVYIDDCCHYTLAGNEILADFIAESISRSRDIPRN
jgi:hypothetical protein